MSLYIAVVVLIATTTADAMSITCSIGEYRFGTKCRKCPPGTYQNELKTTLPACRQCPTDTYNPFYGVISPKLCFPCPTTETAFEGSPQCRKCPVGRVGICGKCVTCPAGTEISREICACSKCYHGDQTISTENSLRCSSCPEGTVPNNERTECTRGKCRDGFFTAWYGCEACSFNNFQRGNMRLCEDCPWGTVPFNKTGPNSRCVPCPAGSFVSAYMPKSDRRPRCLPCPKGTTTKSAGKFHCRRPGEKCPADMFEDADGDCSVCDYNHRVDLVTRRCVPCPKNSVSERGIFKQCAPCQRFASTDRYGSCACRRGYHEGNDGKCTPCPAGTRTGLLGCIPCPVGFFSKPLSEVCEECPEGMTTIKEGSSKCVVAECKKGFIEARLSRMGFRDGGCISGATGCPEGLRLAIRGGAALCVRKDGTVVCPEGEIFNKRDKCIRCTLGDALMKRDGILACRTCPRSAVSPGGLSRSCTPCGNGFTNDEYACYCRNNHFINKKGRCTRCPDQSEARGPNATSCTPCTKGFTTSFPGDSCDCEAPKVLNIDGDCVLP